MAKVTVPKRQITVCDICGRDTGYLRVCLRCGKEYCIMCHAIVCGCGIQPQVCRQCDDNEEVLAICNKYSKRFAKLDEQRADELRKLNTNQ